MPDENLAKPTRPLTPKEAAQYLSISTRTLNRWIEQGIIPVIKLGGSRRFRLEDLMAAIEKNRSGGND